MGGSMYKPSRLGYRYARKDTMKNPFSANTYKVSPKIRGTLNFMQIMFRRSVFASNFQMEFIKALIDELTRLQSCLDQLKTYVEQSKDGVLLLKLRQTIQTLMDENVDMSIAYDLMQAQFERVRERLARKEANETTNQREGMETGVREGCSDAEQTQLGRVRSTDCKQAADDGPPKPATEGDSECDCA